MAGPFTRIRERRDSAANWTSVNPILAEAQFGVELDTLRFKIGDGVTAWNDLDYKSETGPQGPQGPAGAAGSLPIIIGSRASPVEVSGSITNNPASGGDVTMFVAGSGGAAATGTSFTAADSVGSRLRVRGRSASATVFLQNGGNLEMNDMILLGLNSQIEFEWDGTAWVECNRNGL